MPLDLTYQGRTFSNSSYCRPEHKWISVGQVSDQKSSVLPTKYKHFYVWLHKTLQRWSDFGEEALQICCINTQQKPMPCFLTLEKVQNNQRFDSCISQYVNIWSFKGLLLPAPEIQSKTLTSGWSSFAEESKLIHLWWMDALQDKEGSPVRIWWQVLSATTRCISIVWPMASNLDWASFFPCTVIGMMSETFCIRLTYRWVKAMTLHG